MINSRIGLLTLALIAVAGQAATTAEVLQLSGSDRSPEGPSVYFGVSETFGGRVHVNGQASFRFSPAWILGPFTQTAEAIDNPHDINLESALVGGWSFPYARADWDLEACAAAIQAACAPEHHWPAEDDGEPLTTLLRFDHADYRAAQYFPRLSVPGDTAFHVPWTTLPLPKLPDEEPLVWIEGVGRIKGVVEGELTVFVGDSLFLMGDVIVADAILAPCNSLDRFGAVPAESPHRIGLIGKRDVIVAATLENGFANGSVTPALSCGFANDDPVIATCQQSRADIVITAAILAGCSFESEFWRTTARDATVPDSSQNAVCEGWNNTHVSVWSETDCPGAAPLDDRRGKLWLHGSLALGSRGFHMRNPNGPWGSAWIGYTQKVYRYDTRLAAEPPPYWPDVDWTWEGEPLAAPTGEAIEWPGSACGAVDDTTFVENAGRCRAGLRLDGVGPPDLPFRVRVRSDVRTVLDTLLVWHGGPPWVVAPWCYYFDDIGGPDPHRLFEFEEPFWIEVLGDWFEWNVDGNVCQWVFDQYDGIDEVPARPSTPALGLPFPNPFNPATRVTVTLARPETVRLALVDLLGHEVRVVREGPLPAGEHAIAVDGAGLPSGLYLLRLEHGGRVEARKVLLLR